tara:strand:- start:1018 stop:1494 length:477 start_codon:yes stop_codon:yes gene_type:complete
MKEFNYKFDYKNTMFMPNDKRYRIGRGEQGVLLVRPYTDDICKHRRFKTPAEAFVSSTKILFEYHVYKDKEDFIGMDMCRKFLEMGFTRARRYANHKDGKKYDKDGNVKPQEKDWATSDKAKSANIFKQARDRVTSDPIYIHMRKQWRYLENHNYANI